MVVQAWGPGAETAITAAPEVLGCRDSLDGFEPPRGLVAELHHRLPGLRIPRSRAVFDALVASIVEQRVLSSSAHASYREMLRRWGEPAPGPGGLMLPPTADALTAHPYFEFHELGIEMKRANVIRDVARRAARIQGLVNLARAEARRRLVALPGVGEWTAAKVGLSALGDADAVLVGDFHVPNAVAWALAREPRGSDERMLELLAPYPGHRGRVIRLITAAGIHAPRFGPGRRTEDVARL